MRFIIPDLADPNRHPKSVHRAVAQKAQAVRQAWREHNTRVRPLLPSSLQQLQDAHLHDAKIRSLRIDAAQKTLELSLFCCDTPGCLDFILTYEGIQLSTQETSLLCLIAHEPSAEISWDEIDMGVEPNSPIFIHRICWNTGIRIDRYPAVGQPSILYMLTPEIELRFTQFDIQIIPNPEGEFSRIDDFLIVVGTADEIAGMP